MSSRTQLRSLSPARLLAGLLIVALFFAELVGMPLPARAAGTPTLTVSGVPLAGSTQPATFTSDLSDAADVTGEVTWLVDDSFASKTTTPPSGRFIA